jgi:NADH:ubiquinone oxidoreductase subunit H
MTNNDNEMIHLMTIDWWFVLEKFLLVGFVVTLALIVAMYTTYAERKIAAFLQDRRGPNRAGSFPSRHQNFCLSWARRWRC